MIAASGLQSAATRIAYIDAFATARGNAFTATADNPSAIFYNGAGLTQIEGTQIHGNLFTVSLNYSSKSNRAKDYLDDKWQAVPSLFVSHHIANSPLTVGFGVYSPFGLGAKWSSGADIVLDPRVPYEADLVYSKYHVVVAWKTTDELSLSSGLSYDYTDIQVKSNALEYEGNDNTLGFSIAALWQPSPQHSFGLNYQAKTEVTYDGTSTIVNIGKYKSKSDLTYPESIIFGYSFRPNQKWNIEFNVDWTNWDRVDDLVIKGLPSVLGAAPSYELKWNSSFIWELGATHYLKDGWIISAGYTFIENAVPEKTLLPIVPDSDRHAFSIGFGRDHGKMYWQVTCQYIYGIDRKIGNNVYESVNGDYELDSYGAAFSVGYQF